MTEYEARQKVKYWIERSYRTVQLAKHKDPDTYDVLYNVAKDLSVINPSYTRQLQDWATERKKTYVNPNVMDFAKDLDFLYVESKILDVYSEAIIEFFMKQLGVSSYDARQLWLACDKEVLAYL